MPRSNSFNTFLGRISTSKVYGNQIDNLLNKFNFSIMAKSENLQNVFVQPFYGTNECWKRKTFWSFIYDLFSENLFIWFTSFYFGYYCDTTLLSGLKHLVRHTWISDSVFTPGFPPVRSLCWGKSRRRLLTRFEPEPNISPQNTAMLVFGQLLLT